MPRGNSGIKQTGEQQKQKYLSRAIFINFIHYKQNVILSQFVLAANSTLEKIRTITADEAAIKSEQAKKRCHSFLATRRSTQTNCVSMNTTRRIKY